MSKGRWWTCSTRVHGTGSGVLGRHQGQVAGDRNGRGVRGREAGGRGTCGRGRR